MCRVSKGLICRVFGSMYLPRSCFVWEGWREGKQADWCLPSFQSGNAAAGRSALTLEC